jgi:hypothetical protein
MKHETQCKNKTIKSHPLYYIVQGAIIAVLLTNMFLQLTSSATSKTIWLFAIGSGITLVVVLTALLYFISRRFQ